MNKCICGYSVWISTNCRDWYPLYRNVTLAQANRWASQYRQSGNFAEVRHNSSLV